MALTEHQRTITLCDPITGFETVYAF